jgi:hypothetical protein
MKKIAEYGLICVLLVFCACLSRQTVKVTDPDNAKKGQVSFTGGTGDSYETAIVVKGNQYNRKPETAVAAEYEYISGMYGKKDKEWKVEEQSLGQEKDKTYDMVNVKILSTGKTHFFYFDISFFSKKSVPKRPEDL